MGHRVHSDAMFGHFARGLRRGTAIASALLLSTLLTAPAVAFATSDDDPEPQSQGSPNSGGFSLGAPRGFFLVKGGIFVPRANSEIYAFNEEELTLDGNSFISGLFGMDFGFALGDRFDLVFGFEYTSASPVSEFRDYVDEFDAPITQQTRLRTAPLTASVRFNLRERGRAVGNYAWIPNVAVPYVGGGVGIVWWQYEQFGDFIDFTDLTIFTDHFLTQGWDPEFHVFGGVDWSLTPRIALNFEGRYGWAKGDMAPAFVGFDPIDLSGFRGTFGASFRF